MSISRDAVRNGGERSLDAFRSHFAPDHRAGVHIRKRPNCTYTAIMKDASKLDRVVAEARRAAAEREQGYREQALKIYPWICGRCAREFTRTNLRELTVHHRDHDHHNNPPDGSNWELLCLYCHDNEHQRQLEAAADSGNARADGGSVAKHSPFANLKALLDGKKSS
jgi:hypothetical protein